MLAWATMIESILDKFESNQYKHYATFARSNSLASIFAELIGLTGNKPNMPNC